MNEGIRGCRSVSMSVARLVGYRSEPGFSRAFRGILGYPPKQDKAR